jgi:hypothetical protein
MAKPVCEICGRLVHRGGIVALRTEDAYVHVRRWEAYEKEFLVGAGPHIENPSNWPDVEPAHWYWGHDRCLPADLDYWFHGSRIRNPKQALGWTLHLQEKIWFPHTDWEELMRRFGFVEDA